MSPDKNRIPVLDRAVAVREDEAALRKIGEEVTAFMAGFPMPQF